MTIQSFLQVLKLRPAQILFNQRSENVNKLYTDISVTDKYDVLNQDHQNISGKTLKSALTADQLIFNIRDVFPFLIGR